MRARLSRTSAPTVYRDLPERRARWDVGAVRAQRCYAAHQSHENTRFLAAGLPLVSTPILDVVRTYGKAGLVRIAATAADFVREIEGALRESRVDWIRRVDARLAMCSWD